MLAVVAKYMEAGISSLERHSYKAESKNETYIADRKKHIETPKKNVENTTISAVLAVPYRGNMVV